MRGDSEFLVRFASAEYSSADYGGESMTTVIHFRIDGPTAVTGAEVRTTPGREPVVAWFTGDWVPYDVEPPETLKHLVLQMAHDQSDISRAIDFEPHLSDDLDDLLDLVGIDDYDPAEGLPRVRWFGLACAALGKAELIRRGLYDMGDEDDEDNDVWAEDLESIAEVILAEFQPGDGRI